MLVRGSRKQGSCSLLRDDTGEHMEFSKKVILALAAFVAATWAMPSQLRAAPRFVIGLTTRADLTRDLGNPTAEMRFADGVTRVRWPRTVFSGVDRRGDRIVVPETFYDCEFGPDNVLRALRPVDTSVALDSPLLFPEHLDPPIHRAAGSGDLLGVRALLQANPDLVSSKGNNDRSPLDAAARYGHKDVAEFLLANKADANARSDDGRTPLHAAAANGHMDVAELLLASKADVDARDNKGGTALHCAAIEGHRDVADLLLANKATVDAKDDRGRTPLFRAAESSRKDVVELLLANKADVNARIDDGATPLHVAALMGRKDVAELLLASGADVNARDNRGQTPLRAAAAGKNKKALAELLRQHGGHE